VKSRHYAWMVKLNFSDQKKSTCTCPSLFKNYICKHISEIAIIHGSFTVPPKAWNIHIGEKRKPRLTDSRKALIVFNRNIYYISYSTEYIRHLRLLLNPRYALMHAFFLNVK